MRRLLVSGSTTRWADAALLGYSDTAHYCVGKQDSYCVGLSRPDQNKESTILGHRCINLIGTVLSVHVTRTLSAQVDALSAPVFCGLGAFCLGGFC